MVTFVSETVTLGDVIRRFRLHAGMSQIALAEVSGVERTYISMIENNARQPSYEIVKSLAGAMGEKPSAIYRAAEMAMPDRSDEDVAVRVNDPKKAPRIRRIARFSESTLTLLETIGAAVERDAKKARRLKGRASELDQPSS